ncbi:MAG: hypothetical protein IAE97_09250 [Chthoniobacterales bacterium]|nr:hypothetical protein [Chthoniobacterales bacterium]
MKLPTPAILFACAMPLQCLALDLQVVGPDGNPLMEAEAALIFSSGAHQTGRRENEVIKFEPFSGRATLVVAAFGHEGVSRTINPDDSSPVTLKPSANRSSKLLQGKTDLPGKGGAIKISLSGHSNPVIQGFGIGFEAGGRPARQPMEFRLKSPLSAVDSTGGSFKLYVLEVSQSVALVEFTP